MHDAEIKLLVKEKADVARNQAVGILSLIAIVFSLLTGLGIYGLAVRYIDESVKLAIEEEGVQNILSKTKEINSEAEEIINSLRRKDSSVKSLATGAEVVLEDQKSSGWLKKSIINHSFEPPKGYTVTGIGFKPDIFKDKTSEESYQVYYAKLKIKAKLPSNKSNATAGKSITAD